jgi:cytidyltransferase-like protein
MKYPKRILCNGCFDILHVGHLTHLRQAAQMGNVTVAVTQDEFVNKGPGRPFNNVHDRMALLNEFECVWSTIDCRDALHALQMIKPDIFVKGPDYVGKIEKIHEDYCREHGIEIRFTTGQKLSSTAIYDRLRDS